MSTPLAQLQHAMQQAITAGSQSVDLIRGPSDHARAERLAIYRNAYSSRLHEVLAHNFPMLQSSFNEIWESLASGYIDTHPSRFVSIRNFGDRFPQWLQVQCPEQPWLHEFATFEWALGCAFDAPDEIALTSAAFASLTPSQWPQLRCGFAHYVHRLDLTTNAGRMYAAVAASESAIEGRLASPPESWLIWRRGLEACYRSMSALEALGFDALFGGCTFSEMCERLLEHCAEDEVPVQAASYLKRWIADELIVTVCVVPA